jgi:hypothetical protein
MHNGDKNTKYFHAFASERKRRNKIRKIVKEDGSVVTEEEMRSLIANYYLSLFQTHAGDGVEELLQHVQPRVTQELNQYLLKEYTEEEIKKALDSIGDLKASGSDGMPSLFYKHYWHIVGNDVTKDIVGNDVTKEVLNFLNGGTMPENWNETVVVLIPKVENPERIQDLRPISLCNVLYKIASKVISNRLKCILPEVISLNQSTFVLGRIITDNVLLAYEMTHFLQTKRGGRDSYAALKLDMRKAYDRLE